MSTNRSPSGRTFGLIKSNYWLNDDVFSVDVVLDFVANITYFWHKIACFLYICFVVIMHFSINDETFFYKKIWQTYFTFKAFLRLMTLHKRYITHLNLKKYVFNLSVASFFNVLKLHLIFLSLGQRLVFIN